MPKHHVPRVIVAALIIFMLALLSACGAPGGAPTASRQPSAIAAAPSATSEPVVEPATTPASASAASEPGAQPSPTAGGVQFLWPEPLPEGMRVDVAESSIDAAGWTLSLFDPNEPQNLVWIRGGNGPWAEAHPNSRPVQVRGVEGYASSTGAGWGIVWIAGAHYNVGGFLLSAENAVTIAETLQPIDPATFRQRIADAGNQGRSGQAPGADRQLVYARFNVVQQRSELRAVALESGAEQVLAATGHGCTISGLAVSPDGRHIAYSADGCPTPGLYLIGADGSGERVLVEGSSQIGAYAFGPDGTHIALLRMRNADPAPVPETSLWTVAVDDGATTPIVPWSHFIAAPAWIDNGLLVFSQAAGGTPPTDWTTYAVEAHADAEPRALRAGQMLAPAPERNALLMAWETQPGAGSDAVRLGLLPLGGEPRLLDQVPGPLPPAAWSPDGASIAVYDWNAHMLQTVDVASGQRHDVAYSVPNLHGVRTAWTADGRLLTAMGMQGSEAVELRLHDTLANQARVLATIDSLPDFVAVTK